MSGGLFFGINIALKGMMAQQTALTVASHNIANANTGGYSRQRVDMETSIPVPGLMPGAGQLGSGVDVAQVKRMRDTFLDYQVRQELSTLGKWEAIRDNLEQVELIFMEPTETGFNELMGEFWNGWQEVAKYAESSPIRTTLKETSVALTDVFHHMRQQLTDIKNDIQSQTAITVTGINTLAERIASLNEQIVKINITGENPNDLLDKRDLAFDELAQIANITTEYICDEDGNPTGAVKITIGDTVIVDDEGAKEIIDNDGKYVIEGEEISITDGMIAGFNKAGGEEDITGSVQHYINKLDALAVSLAEAVNGIHTTGKTLNGDAGGDFFVFLNDDGIEIDLSAIDWDDPFSSGLSAANIYVNPDIVDDVSNIAAAADEDGSFSEGNGEIALEIAQLQDANLINGTTLGNFYKDMIAELGVATNQSQRMVTNQNSLLTQVKNRRESLMGVNLDEEMAHMVNFQHAFNANARVISVMDELLNTVVNGLIR